MRRHAHTLTVSLLLLGVPSLAFAAQEARANDAQEKATTDARQQQPRHYMTASELIGKDVLSRADASGDREDLGDVSDLVVDAASGEITEVVVSSGGLGSVGDTLRKIPYSTLRFDRSDDGVRVWIDRSEDEFTALAKIEEKDLEPLRCGTIAASAANDGRAVREASLDRRRAASADEAGARRSIHVLASELDDLDFRAAAGSRNADGEPISGDSLGKVDEAWLCCEDGKIEFLTYEHDDRLLVLPMSVVVTAIDTNDDEVYITSPRPVQALAGAPCIDEKVGDSLANPDFRTRVATFYADDRSAAAQRRER